MIRKSFLTLALGLVLSTALQGQPPARTSQPAPDTSRDAIETFRKLLLKQLGPTTTALHPVPIVNVADGGALWLGRAQEAKPPVNVTPLGPDGSSQGGSAAARAALNDYLLAGDAINFTPTGQPRNWTYRAATTSSSVEGTYVSGQGILFLGTVHHIDGATRAAPGGWFTQRYCASCHTSTNETPKEDVAKHKLQQADAEWELMRTGVAKHPAKNAMTGVKPIVPAVQPCQPSLLVQRVIQLLADHGHRFPVKPEERITIQLHVRPNEMTVAAANGSFQPSALQYFDWKVIRSPDNPHGVVDHLFEAAQPSGKNPEKTVDPLATQPPGDGSRENTHTFVRRQIALGELHSKESNYDKALEAYRKIYESAQTLDPATRADAYKRAAELLIKQGKVEEAQATLRKYSELLAAKPQKSSNLPPAAPAAATDWTITISTTKNECDMLRSGKRTFEDFVKIVEVNSGK